MWTLLKPVDPPAGTHFLLASSYTMTAARAWQILCSLQEHRDKERKSLYIRYLQTNNLIRWSNVHFNWADDSQKTRCAMVYWCQLEVPGSLLTIFDFSWFLFLCFPLWSKPFRPNTCIKVIIAWRMFRTVIIGKMVMQQVCSQAMWEYSLLCQNYCCN